MSNHKITLYDLAVTRREFLQRCGMGLGSLALLTMLGEQGLLSPVLADEAAPSLDPKQPPLPCKAKHVIHLFMSGGPSHVDTFDPKPALAKYRGKPVGGQ